jgi:formylglycine-generating enzyme required for sulfatase activity
MLILLGLALMLTASLAPARAERRLALVIGENTYKNLPEREQLHNAVNDARAMKQALETLHFEVDLEENLDRPAFIEKLSKFGARLERDDVAFFFYAGHGVSFDGANFLLPTDIPRPESSGRDEQERMADSAIAEMRVLERIRRSGARLAVVVLDACRDNPLKSADDRSVGDTRGLSVAPGVKGVLEIYSAGPGQTALDGGSGEANSLFTKIFAEKLRTPGLGLRALAYRTQAEVERRAADQGHEQFPVVASQIETPDVDDDDVYLSGRPAPKPQPAPDEGAVERQAAYDSAMDAGTIEALDAFLAKYPEGGLGKSARRERERLARLKLAEIAPKPLPTPAPAGPCGGVTSASLASRGVGVLKADEACALTRGDVFKECADCPAMVVVPEGSFTMGSPASEGGDDDEHPQHVVKIAHEFAVGKFDVTKDEFVAFVRAANYDAGTDWKNPGFAQTGSDPVVNVSWNDAKAYVNWLSDKTKRPYRLLSESEWEYSARAGASTAYFWGASIGKNNANCDGCGSRWDNKQTSPSGSFAPNAFGLYDMHGNAWQWVEDCYRGSYSGAPEDGSPVITGECGQRVIRGGSWFFYPRDLRAAQRSRNDPSLRVNRVGFRVARTLLP